MMFGARKLSTSIVEDVDIPGLRDDVAATLRVIRVAVVVGAVSLMAMALIMAVTAGMDDHGQIG
jgi:hypothetical protein